MLWDIGANLGLHGLTVAKLRPDVQVECFEPNPAMSDIIIAAISQNLLTNVKVHQVALSDRDGDSVLHTHPGNLGMSSLYLWSESPRAQPINILVKTARTIVDTGVPSPNVIKLDVEGHEELVLVGLSEIPCLAKLHAIVFEDGREDSSAVKQRIRDIGLCIRMIDRVDPETSHDLENYVAIK